MITHAPSTRLKIIADFCNETGIYSIYIHYTDGRKEPCDSIEEAEELLMTQYTDPELSAWVLDETPGPHVRWRCMIWNDKEAVGEIVQETNAFDKE